MQTPAQREILDRLTGVMSLLEGHADFVMDGVGPDGRSLRRRDPARFEPGAAAPGAVDGLVRRLLGLDAKMAQYADGAAFVRAVVDRVGADGFNRGLALSRRTCRLARRDRRPGRLVHPGARRLSSMKLASCR